MASSDHVFLFGENLALKCFTKVENEPIFLQGKCQGGSKAFNPSRLYTVRAHMAYVYLLKKGEKQQRLTKGKRCEEFGRGSRWQDCRKRRRHRAHKGWMAGSMNDRLEHDSSSLSSTNMCQINSNMLSYENYLEQIISIIYIFFFKTFFQNY